MKEALGTVKLRTLPYLWQQAFKFLGEDNVVREGVSMEMV